MGGRLWVGGGRTESRIVQMRFGKVWRVRFHSLALHQVLCPGFRRLPTSGLETERASGGGLQPRSSLSRDPNSDLEVGRPTGKFVLPFQKVRWFRAA